MSALCQVSWIFPAPTFYSTLLSQKQRTHSRYLSRQMSYDSSFLFHSHSVSIGSVFGVSFTRQRLSNHRLHTSLYTWQPRIPFENLLHSSYFLCTYALACLSLHARAERKPITLLRTLCCKIFVLKYFRRTPTLRNFSTRKFFQRKFRITKISRFMVLFQYPTLYPFYSTWAASLYIDKFKFCLFDKAPSSESASRALYLSK